MVFGPWTLGQVDEFMQSERCCLRALQRTCLAVCQNLVPLVNIKIAGKWMFIPVEMVLIGIDPYPSGLGEYRRSLEESICEPAVLSQSDALEMQMECHPMPIQSTWSTVQFIFVTCFSVPLTRQVHPKLKLKTWSDRSFGSMDVYGDSRTSGLISVDAGFAKFADFELVLIGRPRIKDFAENKCFGILIYALLVSSSYLVCLSSICMQSTCICFDSVP